MRSTNKNRALFLDRDGVLIEYIPYLSHPDQVKIPIQAGETLKKWQDAGYRLIVITNQSGVGRGYFTMDDVESVHRQMRDRYECFNIQFQDIFVCPHHPMDNCKCRKPSPQMVMEAAQKYMIDISQSFFLGDAISDIECAINAGCPAILLRTTRTKSINETYFPQPNFVQIVNDLRETMGLIPSTSIYE